MVLIDTSVWISHFRKRSSALTSLLENGDVVIHPYIIGELACGGLTNRLEILSLLQALPVLESLPLDEYLYFVDSRKLTGKGIGFVDIHLLASALLASDFIWTLDTKLHAIAKKLKVAYIT